MDFCKTTTLPFTVKLSPFPSTHARTRTGTGFGRPSVSVVVCLSRCGPSLNTPLEPRSATGRYLTSVLQNQRHLFHTAVEAELKLLAGDRDEAVLRVAVASAGDEACLYRFCYGRLIYCVWLVVDEVATEARRLSTESELGSDAFMSDKEGKGREGGNLPVPVGVSQFGSSLRRNARTKLTSLPTSWRIAEIKQRDWQISITDLMYMVILFKFSEIKVHLVPKLSKCVYNGRLEIWPAKDWELESIHSIDTLEMIKDHIAAVIGLKADSSVTDSWAITQVERPRLGNVYASSILYGYFLKSVSMRHNLEHSLALPRLGHSSQKCNYGWSNLLFGRINRFQTGRSLIMEEKRSEKLQCYVSGFDKETLQRRMKVRSKEAADLIEKHTRALFGNGVTGLVESSDETIITSFSSLRRLVLEAVAFGSFLWDVEEYIDTVYKLNDN